MEISIRQSENYDPPAVHARQQRDVDWVTVVGEAGGHVQSNQ